MKKYFNELTIKPNLIKHIKIALFVGFVLNIINQFENIININLHGINFLKAAITFFIPFAVSIYSSANTTKIENHND